jgi:gas vesicle protein
MFKTRKEEKQDAVKKFAIGAAITGLLGYLVGILTAPKSGKETREDIRDRAYETYGAAEKELKKLHTELVDLIDEATDRVTEFRNRKDVKAALQNGHDARQKAREVLSTLHDGEANDKDLKKAISDATKAIEHLRDFLRK